MDVRTPAQHPLAEGGEGLPLAYPLADLIAQQATLPLQIALKAVGGQVLGKHLVQRHAAVFLRNRLVVQQHRRVRPRPDRQAAARAVNPHNLPVADAAEQPPSLRLQLDAGNFLLPILRVGNHELRLQAVCRGVRRANQREGYWVSKLPPLPVQLFQKKVQLHSALPPVLDKVDAVADGSIAAGPGHLQAVEHRPHRLQPRAA